MVTRATLRVLAAASIAAMFVGALAVPAGATTRAALSEADCETLVSELGDNIDTTRTSGLFGAQAKAIADGLDETASDIQDKKLRKSLRGMADYFDELSDVDSIIDAGKVTLAEGRRYGKAVGRYTKALATCTLSRVTLPAGVTLPSGITLPSGVTIPSVTLPR